MVWGFFVQNDDAIKLVLIQWDTFTLVNIYIRSLKYVVQVPSVRRTYHLAPPPRKKIGPLKKYRWGSVKIRDPKSLVHPTTFHEFRCWKLLNNNLTNYIFKYIQKRTFGSPRLIWVLAVLNGQEQDNEDN